MLKKLSILLLALTMIIACTACGSEGQTESSSSEAETDAESTEAVDGGWEIVDNEAAALPEEVQAAFEKALEKFTGSEMKPVAYVANQFVEGTNYMILCEAATTTAEPVTTYQMAVIYADLEGNAELTTIKEFSMGQYLEEGDGGSDQGEISGGWSVPEELAGSPIPEEAQKAFDKATETFTGSTLEPIALLETQVVAGMNYAFICKSTPAVQEPVPSIQIVTVYEDLEGNAEISTICTVDPADYNE